MSGEVGKKTEEIKKIYPIDLFFRFVGFPLVVIYALMFAYASSMMVIYGPDSQSPQIFDFIFSLVLFITSICALVLIFLVATHKWSD